MRVTEGGQGEEDSDVGLWGGGKGGQEDNDRGCWGVAQQNSDGGFGQTGQGEGARIGGGRVRQASG